MNTPDAHPCAGILCRHKGCSAQMATETDIESRDLRAQLVAALATSDAYRIERDAAVCDAKLARATLATMTEQREQWFAEVAHLKAKLATAERERDEAVAQTNRALDAALETSGASDAVVAALKTARGERDAAREALEHIREQVEANEADPDTVLGGIGCIARAALSPAPQAQTFDQAPGNRSRTPSASGGPSGAPGPASKPTAADHLRNPDGSFSWAPQAEAGTGVGDE